MSHVLCLLLFLALGLSFQVNKSLIGILVLTIVIVFVLCDQLIIAFFLTVLELMSVVFIDVLWMGWESGFNYYYLLIIPIFALAEKTKLKYKIMVGIFVASAYTALHFFVLTREPIVKLPEMTVLVIGDMNIITTFYFLSVVLYIFGITVLENERKLKDANEKLKNISETDQLTGIYNRRYAFDILNNEITHYNATKNKFVIAIADIDDFKRVNDKYGHICGDYILLETVNHIKKVLRKQDILARWGGEEFVIILPNTQKEEGKIITERIRKVIESNEISYENEKIKITITIGWAIYDDTYTFNQIIQKADMFLYQGKANGKNCICSEAEGQ